MDITKKRRELTAKDRYVIEKCMKEQLSYASIAKLLGVCSKTISRELKRGLVEQKDTSWLVSEVYKADYAEDRHKESVKCRGRKPSYHEHEELIAHIRDKFRKKWSPDAIIGSLRREGKQTVCTKTVCNWLRQGYIDGFRLSRSKQHKVKQARVGYHNATAKRIDERPREADERQAGHWEMDLVVSGQNCSGSLLVFTERFSRCELICLLKDKRHASVISALDSLERKYKSKFRDMFKTITCDNGSEFLDSKGLERSCLDAGERTEIYYAHPYSSWERGSNENANKLIRKFIKKGEDISKLPLAYIKRIEKWMNSYPRRLLGYRTASDARID